MPTPQPGESRGCLVPRRIRRQDREPRFLRATERAFEPFLKAPEVLSANHFGNVEAGQCHGIVATLAFDPESAFETGEIAGRADVP